MNPADAARFDKIRREVQYGATLKDLLWLVRLVERLEREAKAESAKLPPITKAVVSSKSVASSKKRVS